MAAAVSTPALSHGLHGFWGAPTDYGTNAHDRLKNRAAAVGALGAPAPELVLVQQIHSSSVVEATGQSVESLAQTPADAVLCDEPGRAVGVLTADCVPLLMLAPDCGWVAAIHAGRVGALAQIVSETIAALERRGARRRQCKIWVGPHIVAASYEVGQAMFETLPQVAQARQADGRFCCDLRALIEAQLSELKISSTQVVWSDIDTCTNKQWHSYRRDGALAGRNLSAIAVPTSR